VARAVAALRAAGVKVALDEVDGEAPSLACLQAERFDQLKFAGGVVRAAVAGERGRRLLAGLLRLAAATGASTVAKQIETLPQAWAMQRAGVAFGQGWLFGVPERLSGA
jgi:EAL domain-containing protein (putative c-di-GMP-specific phosphodiesterase class I)